VAPARRKAREAVTGVAWRGGRGLAGHVPPTVVAGNNPTVLAGSTPSAAMPITFSRLQFLHCPAPACFAKKLHAGTLLPFY